MEVFLLSWMDLGFRAQGSLFIVTLGLCLRLCGVSLGLRLDLRVEESVCMVGSYDLIYNVVESVLGAGMDRDQLSPPKRNRFA